MLSAEADMDREIAQANQMKKNLKAAGIDLDHIIGRIRGLEKEKEAIET